MKVTRTSLNDVIVIEPVVYCDERGWFMESFNEALLHKSLFELGLPIPKPFVQSNHSSSKKNVLRGLHYQLPPHAQGKLVRVTRGSAFDVVVDIRIGSATYGKWVGVELNEVNKKMLWIPEGFAHGFLALADNTEFQYKTTDYYSKVSERSIRWDDPSINILWPGSEKGAFNISTKDEEAFQLHQIDRNDFFV